MPRKKPFSGKQKKKQLHDKRLHKVEQLTSETETATEGNGASENSSSSEARIHRVADTNSLQDNRYRLLFFKETNTDLTRNKTISRRPYAILPEACLEQDLDQPGTVLDIPKRPSWSTALSKEQLECREEEYFETYVQSISKEHIGRDLGYFELNLETWRQLWRVIEMSDVLLVVTDIRNPAFLFPPALYTHVTQDAKKPMIIVLNKADLAPPAVVVSWRYYLKQHYPLLHIVCFTSNTPLPCDGEHSEETNLLSKKRNKRAASGCKELLEVCQNLVQDRVDLSSWKSMYEVDPLTGDLYRQAESAPVSSEPTTTFTPHHQFRDGILTIGCVGYPNVGKSSIINSLMRRKVVSVSKSPGHTKHFQTMFLAPTVKLCDCPGLVFPSLVTKSLQVVSGVYPVAQLRDPCSAVGFLAQRLDLPRFLKLAPPPLPWSAYSLCEAWAVKCGYRTAKGGRPDTYRAANYILRLAVEGRLRLCFLPPGYVAEREYWKNHKDTRKLQDMYKATQEESHLSTQVVDDNSSESDSDSSGVNEDSSGEEESTSQATPFLTVNQFDVLNDSCL